MLKYESRALTVWFELEADPRVDDGSAGRPRECEPPAGVLSTSTGGGAAPIALFGLVRLGEQGLVLDCLSVIGPTVRGQFGRILPGPYQGR